MPAAVWGKWRRRYASVGALARGVFGPWRYCIMCAAQVPAFLPWRGGWAGVPPLMRALETVGSDPDNFLCPRCRCTDRERHLRLYLERTRIADRFKGARVLHFAPEGRLASWIASLGPGQHVFGDLHPSRPDIQRMDLEAIPFADGSFDFVIANHVLEHVTHLDRATSEIARVLAHDGLAILQTPWAKGLEATLDDPTVTDVEARLQLYGQEDHVRLFGRDVYPRIGAGGLVAIPATHRDILADVDARHYGVNPDEDLMLFQPRRPTAEPAVPGASGSAVPPR